MEILAKEGTILALKDSGNSNILRDYIMRTKGIPGFTVLTGMEFLVDTAIRWCPRLGAWDRQCGSAEYVELYNLSCAGEYQRPGTAGTPDQALRDLLPGIA